MLDLYRSVHYFFTNLFLLGGVRNPPPCLFGAPPPPLVLTLVPPLLLALTLTLALALAVPAANDGAAGGLLTAVTLRMVRCGLGTCPG
jgi:hypothetical protein